MFYYSTYTVDQQQSILANNPRLKEVYNIIGEATSQANTKTIHEDFALFYRYYTLHIFFTFLHDFPFSFVLYIFIFQDFKRNKPAQITLEKLCRVYHHRLPFSLALPFMKTCIGTLHSTTDINTKKC